MDVHERKALDDIDEFGCHVLSLSEDEEGPGFCYSIGIGKTQGKPDLIALGLKQELAHSIINNYKDRPLAGQSFEIGKYYSDFLRNFEVH